MNAPKRKELEEAIAMLETQPHTLGDAGGDQQRASFAWSSRHDR